jgi:hypothetical protein
MFRSTTLVVLALSSLFGGCASIVNGQNQSVSVEARNDAGAVSGAQCKLTNNKGVWYVTAPGSAVVNRSYEDLAVRCEKEQMEPGLVSVKSSTKPMAFGNIIFGGIIGAGIDMSSGAAYDYPTLITVLMGRSTVQEAAPAAAATTGPAAPTAPATTTPPAPAAAAAPAAPASAPK